MLRVEQPDNQSNQIHQGKIERKIFLEKNLFFSFRLVYKWFLLVYKVSYGLAIAGYFIIMMTFLGINNLFLIAPQVIEKEELELYRKDSIVDWT
jgi:hypothetical protein